MKNIAHHRELFEGVNFSEKRIINSEFENCEFKNCNFSSCDLGGSDFTSCSFTACDFTLTSFQDTGLKDVKFKDCKLMGIEFGSCSDFLFYVSFRDCNLNYSSFIRKKMKKSVFTNCSLRQVDFRYSDLSQGIFNDCELLEANFSETILLQTDFRRARSFSIDPELSKLKGAKFNNTQLAGLLLKYDLVIEY